MKLLDLTGKEFGLLTVIRRSEDIIQENGRKRLIWVCKCKCGNIVEVRGESLKAKYTSSCGCVRKKMTKNKNLSHGRARTKEYKSWCHIKQRCYNPNNSKYEDYGQRGIKMCDRWLSSFENFLSDMGDAPTSKHTIDRIDVNGDYTPENCRWANPFIQANNKRNSKYVSFNGEQKTLKEWSEVFNVNYKTFWYLYVIKNLTFKEIEKWQTFKNSLQ